MRSIGTLLATKPKVLHALSGSIIGELSALFIGRGSKISWPVDSKTCGFAVSVRFGSMLKHAERWTVSGEISDVPVVAITTMKGYLYLLSPINELSLNRKR